MSKAQKEKILKLNIKDKKLARLFFCPDLTQKDTLFLNYAYEQRQNLHFRYAFAFAIFASVLGNYAFFRYSPTITQIVGFTGIFLANHFYWTSVTSKRFSRLIEPYFQKYSIK